MALYRITNLKVGTIVLPPPLSRRLNRGETVEISAPAGMTEANFNRQYSALVQMKNSGIISITTREDPHVDNNIEVATVSMIGPGSSGSGGMPIPGPQGEDGDDGWMMPPGTSAPSGASVPATQVGQVLLSVDGSSFSAQLPLTSVALDRGGWLVNDQGYLMVVG